MGQSLPVLPNKKKGSKGPIQHVLPIPRKLFFSGWLHGICSMSATDQYHLANNIPFGSFVPPVLFGGGVDTHHEQQAHHYSHFL